MKFLRELLAAVENDVFIKLVFDHLRNYALCALVIAVADWQMKKQVATAMSRSVLNGEAVTAPGFFIYQTH